MKQCEILKHLFLVLHIHLVQNLTILQKIHDTIHSQSFVYSKRWRANGMFSKPFLSQEGKDRKRNTSKVTASYKLQVASFVNFWCASSVSSDGGFLSGYLLSGFLTMSEGCMDWQGDSLTLKMEEPAQQRSLHLPVYRGQLDFCWWLLGTSQWVQIFSVAT